MRAEKFAVVSVLDPAIDTERMPAKSMAEYITTRDLKHVDPYLKPGELPTIYHVRAVPHSLWEQYVMAVDNQAERYRRCFMAGVERVQNIYQDDGPRIESWQPGKPGELMPEEMCVRFSPAEREEIGSVVWSHSFLPRRTAANFRLPPSSHAALIERTFRPAAANPSSPASDSEKASSAVAEVPLSPPEIGSSSSSSGDGFASHTGASAVVIESSAA
jgi:hypothetical protein